MTKEAELTQAAAAGAGYVNVASTAIANDRANAMCSHIRSLEYPPATKLFQQGARASEVYLVDKGLIKLTRLNEDGQEMITSLRSTGSILGAATAIVHKPHPVTAMTLTRCFLRRISLEDFFHLVRTDDNFCWYLHRSHSLEVHQQASQLIRMKYLSARQRLEQLVWQLLEAIDAGRQDGPVRLHLPLKYWEIAQLIGITPEHLSRVLKQIQDDGIMSRENGSLIITDIEGLRDSLDAYDSER
jgi:CRP-like cAMP-binding protein